MYLVDPQVVAAFVNREKNYKKILKEKEKSTKEPIRFLLERCND